MDMERKKFLKKLMAIEFKCIDLNLYLDTHPKDVRALEEYNLASNELLKLKKEYEARYGPLIHFGFSPSPRSWRWIDDPWPWEISM